LRKKDPSDLLNPLDHFQPQRVDQQELAIQLIFAISLMRPCKKQVVLIFLSMAQQ